MNVKIKDNDDDLVPICSDCSNSSLDFCEDCKQVTRCIDLRHDYECKAYCPACLSRNFKICQDCDFLALFLCSCNLLFCKFCAEKHFVDIYNQNLSSLQSGSTNFHYFSSYPSANSGKQYFAPDFRSFFLRKFMSYLQTNPKLSNQIKPIERIADYYSQIIKIIELTADSDLKTSTLAKIYFASGYYQKFCENFRILTQNPTILSLSYAPFFYLLSFEKINFSQVKQSNQNTQKFDRKMIESWTSYKKSGKMKKFGKFVSKHQFIQPGKDKLKLFVLAGLETENPKKLMKIIDHLNFYYQDIQENALLYSRLSELESDLDEKIKYAKISFQILARFTGFDNFHLTILIVNYCELVVKKNQEEGKSMFLRLFEETYLAKAAESLDYLKSCVGKFGFDNREMTHLNSLKIN